MNILFLAQRIPYPPNKGDKIRSFNEIKYLSRQHNIYLGTLLDREEDKRHMDGLVPYCRELCAVYSDKRFNVLTTALSGSCCISVVWFYNRLLQRYVDHILRTCNIDVVICFCSVMAEYIFRSPFFKQNEKNIKYIMDYVDLDSDKWLQYASYASFPKNIIYKIENFLLSRYELKINKRFQHSVFISQREVDIFIKHSSAVDKLEVIPNGVDSTFFTPKKTMPNNDNPILLFTGVMDYFANEDGVIWFCENIYTLIKSEFPDVRFYIAGNRPSMAVRSLELISGVVVTGFVEDIRQYYWLADICVIPLRIARGLQNKVIEAMSTGNAVVATSNAADGIVCKDGVDIIIADSESQMAEAIIRLLRDQQVRTKLAENAVQNIKKNYSWDLNLKGLDKLLV